MPNAMLHPTPQELNAFTLGKLGDAGTAAVARHLETCSACRQVIEKLPADSFVGKVRAAKPSVSALPARPVEVAKAPPLPPKDLPPDLANYSKYRFVRELGRGGMGVVYQAEQTVMGRSVAVKVINPSVLDHPDALPRFQSEVRAAAKLDHPSIVRAYDAEQVGSMHLLVMEYVEGTSLADLVAKKGPLSVPYACHYVRQAALGLQHAFEQDMVHRDIKPQNLMVNARGQLKVLDFGLARMQSERKAGGGLTQADAFMGTPEYVSPEQATDARSADTRADIYSLGCTLFFLLAGRPPFQGDTAVKLIMAHIEKEAPALQEVRPDVPAELSAVVVRMLAKDPAQRFQTPVEVAQALAAFVKPGTKQASGVSPTAADVSSPGTGTMLSADTSKIKAILGDVPRKAPASDVPAKDAASSVFASVGEPVASAKKKGKALRKAAEPVTASAQPSSRKKWLLGGGIGVGVLLLALLGMWAGGVFKVKTKDGTIVLENLTPDSEVIVNGEKVTLQTSDGKLFTIGVAPGKKQRLQVRKEGFTTFGEAVEIEGGGRQTIKVRLDPLPGAAPDADHMAAGRADSLRGADQDRLKGEQDRKQLGKTSTMADNRVRWISTSYNTIILHMSGKLWVDVDAATGKQKSELIEETRTPDYIELNGRLGVFVGIVRLRDRRMDMQKNGKWEWLSDGWWAKPATDQKIGDGETKPRAQSALKGSTPPPKKVENEQEFAPKANAPRAIGAAAEEQGFVPLFNGKDLTGWKVSGGGTGNWKVEEGDIVGSGPMSHLFSERGDYENFHFRVDAMISDGGNSGQYFRAQLGPGFPAGYEAQINSTGNDPNKTGSLYRIANVTDQLHKPGEWFTQEVIAQGDHIVIKVNDKKVVDTHDSRYKKGHFALQQHDSATVVKFRKIEIKELPAEPSSTRKGDSIPPEAKGAAKVYEKACVAARAKLLADFDAAVDQLARMKGSSDVRLKLVEAVKAEKKRFERKGLIPWSGPMRPFLAKYFASISAAEDRLRHVYNSIILAQHRAKNESAIAELKADLTNLIGVRLLARWRHFGNGTPQGVHSLYSNGKMDNVNGSNTWTYAKGVLIYRFPNTQAPGGAWIDTLNISADGATYEGTNNFPPGRRPKITGAYLND